MTSDSFHWSIDLLIAKNGTYFCHGWVFHETQVISELSLRILNPDAVSQSLAAEYGKLRADVAKAFPGAPSSMHSGFFLFGGVPTSAGVRPSFSIVGVLGNNELFELDVPDAKITWLDAGSRAGKLVLLRQLGTFARRGLTLLKDGQFLILAEKAKRYLQRMPWSFVSDVDTVISKYVQDRSTVNHLIVDHDLGGGANHYREKLVKKKLSEGIRVFIVTYHVATLSYVLVVREKASEQRFAIPDLGFLVGLGKKLVFDELTYNTAVSFVKSDELPLVLVSMKKLSGVRLTLLVHDFFMVCPSHFLINSNGNYCGIPELAECRACLPVNQQGFATLFEARDIKIWRELWGCAIEAADNIVTFSENSLSILKKAYPLLDMERCSVVPHQVDYLGGKRIQIKQIEKITIGVIGQIGHHKGSEFLLKLAEEIVVRRLNVKIVVVGTLETRCDPKVVKQTGPYRPEELSSLILRHGINVVLFPSIWPETFSYVVQEMIELNLPVACFDLGAPAERLSKYSKGLVLTGFDPKTTLNELVSFHKSLYLQN